MHTINLFNAQKLMEACDINLINCDPFWEEHLYFRSFWRTMERLSRSAWSRSTGVCFMKIEIQKWHLPIHLDISVKSRLRHTYCIFTLWKDPYCCFSHSSLLHVPNLDKKRRMSNQLLSKTEIFLTTNHNLPQYPLGKNSPLLRCLPNLKNYQISTSIPFNSSSNR